MREKLGQGRQAEVFAYDNDKAVKLFYPNTPYYVIEHEFQNSRIINNHHLPTAKAYELIREDGRDGIVYEKVEGPTMLKMLLSDISQMAWVGEQSARLHARVHRCRNDDLPSQKQLLEKRILSAPVDEEIRDAALRELNSLPEDNEVCHGDFHPDNIVISPRGPVLLDWVNATRGNRIADFILSALIFKIGQVPDFIPNARSFNHGRGRASLYKAYITTYLNLIPTTKEELIPWVFPVAVARLGDHIESEKARLLKIVTRLARRLR